MYVYYRNTKDRLADEHEAEAMEAADEAKVAIDYPQFAQEVPDFGEIAAQLGYDDDLPVEKDWSVSFCESTYDGEPCLIFCHTECDFIFLPPEAARRRAEAFALAANPADWRRKTEFGKGGIDPTPADFG